MNLRLLEPREVFGACEETVFPYARGAVHLSPEYELRVGYARIRLCRECAETLHAFCHAVNEYFDPTNEVNGSQRAWRFDRLLTP